MRCPKCKGFMPFSFIDDVTLKPVYQCGTVGVTTTRTIGPRTHQIRTLDHSELFFIVEFGKLVQVKPVRLSRAQSDAVLSKNGFPPYYDEATKTREFPQAWTTARA